MSSGHIDGEKAEILQTSPPNEILQTSPPKEDLTLSHTEHVRQIINIIRRSTLSEKEKKKHFCTKYPNFAESMPKLFDMSVKDVTKNPENDKYLNMMLDMSERLMDKKDIDVIEADKAIYGRLREDYVDPHIKPDKQKIDEFMSKGSYTNDELNQEPKINIVQKEK